VRCGNELSQQQPLAATCRNRYFPRMSIKIPFRRVIRRLYTTNQEVKLMVETFYRELLGRSPDAVGAQVYENLIRREGAARGASEMLRALLDSTEYKKRIHSAEPAGADQAKLVVDIFYREILGRQPDAKGLQTYESLIQREGTAAGIRAMLRSFLDSPEYKESIRKRTA
jgi:hypothetical protein